MKKSLFFLCLLLCTHVYLIGGSSQELEKGRILPKVICRDNPENSYALFLPSAYTPEADWPILFALDPGARGHIPVELFRQAAEKYHYILVGSNNSQNGPWENVIQSLIILWNEINERYSIDKKRIYVTGFSGGSRAASIFARVIMFPVAGIIGCGAGLAKSLIKPDQITPAYYLGIVGITDFNYREMMLLRDQLEQHSVAHRFLVHMGGHDWPPEDICLRALEWMEIVAIRNNIRAMDEDLIDTVFEKEKETARSLESAGELSRALLRYRLLADTFSTWQNTSPIRTKIQTIQKSEDYLNDRQDEKRIQELEMQYLRKFGQVFSQIEKNPPPAQNIESFIANLGLDDLKEMAANSQSGRAHFMAIRLLLGLEFDAGSKGRELFQKSEFPKAILFFEIATQGGDEDSYWKKTIHYNLACAYARIQNEKKALENLRLAVEHGFDDIEHIKQDKDLASLRDSKEFQKIIKDRKQNNIVLIR
jgi:predicted esterase